MKTIFAMFVAMLFAVPLGVANAQSLTKDLTDDLAQLYQEHATVKKSDAALVRLLTEQAPKLAAQRAALVKRQAEFAGSKAKYDAASDEYSASCRVFFPKKVPCAAEKARLAQWETNLAVLHERIEKHAAALTTDEWYFATRQKLHEKNLEHLSNIERYAAFMAKNPAKQGGLRACFPKLASR